MLRKSWIPLAAVGLVVTLVVQLGQPGDEASARARDGRALRAAPAASESLLPEVPAPAPMLLIGPDAPADLGGAVTTDIDATAAAELSPADQKAVDKLQKKLNKAQARQAKAELKGANFADAIAAAESDLSDAQALPDGPAKDKAVAKLTKLLAKLQAKLDKAQAKLDAAGAVVNDLTAQIEVIDPNHFSGIDGLQAPDQMDIVTTVDGGGGSAIWGGGGNTSNVLSSTDYPPTSDYALDPVHSHVFDTSMSVLDNVDQILCFMAHTAYDAMVNKGTYVAQVDESQCSSGQDQGSGQGESSSSGAPTPKMFVVHSERDSDTSPEVMSFWVPEGGPGDDSKKSEITIRAKMTVTEGITDLDPYGKFKLDFAGVPPGGSLNNPVMHGTLETLDVADGHIGFSFYDSEGDLNATDFPPGSQAELTQANVNMFADQSQGVARVRRQFRENFGPDGDTGIQTEEYLLAFDADSLLRGAGGEPGQCLSRTEFATQIFRYSLYQAAGDDAGARVELNAGFNIKLADGGFGWAGYYGVCLPPNEPQLHSGDTVTKAVFGPDSQNQPTYTVLVAPGHLIRNTRQQLSLADADGMSFEWMEFQNQGPPPPPPPGPGDPPPFSPPTHWRVTYHNDTGEFLKVATLDESTGTWTDVPDPQPVDLQSVGVLQMFSQGLGGSVSFVPGDDHLTFFKQTFVNPSDEIFAGGDDVPLFGYMNCLKGEISADDASSGNVFQTNSFDVASPHQYRLRRSDMTLYLDNEGDQSNLIACELVDGAQPQGGPFQWGMQAGPLLTDTSGLQDTFSLWNQPVFYTWETGANSWNKLSMLIDGDGNAVAFDPPLQFSYQHSLENDANGDPTWAGKTFLLNYNGPGDLFGIPMEPTDLDGDGIPDRWYPQFSITDGVLMGPSGDEYVIKGIDKELTLHPGAPGLCDGQTIDPVADLPLPDGSDYVAPDIGPKPVIDSPPAVIDGVVQTPGT